jgi:catechol 2,3-dioxygenase-like lactoylglutathione lyase family enzyme
MPQSLNPTLFSVELRTGRWHELVAWYRDRLGLGSLLRSEEDQYALLSLGGARLAILGRNDADPPSGRWSLALEVSHLDALANNFAAGPVQKHPEGYRYLKLTDPDGNRLTLIDWRQPSQ